MNKLQRERRIYAITRIGCLPCRHRGIYGMPPDIHHPNSGGHAGQKRMGDDVFYGACPWHHRGIPLSGKDEDWCRMHFGPSRAKEPNAFREEFGTEDELLAEQEKLIGLYESNVIGRTA
jgi:hypothetical protein